MLIQATLTKLSGSKEKSTVKVEGGQAGERQESEGVRRGCERDIIYKHMYKILKMNKVNLKNGQKRLMGFKQFTQDHRASSEA